MTDSFHYDLAVSLKERFGDKISDICIIFPTRRAKLFFGQALHQVYQSSLWMPEIYAIDDWICEINGGIFPDTLELIVILHEVYQKEMRKIAPSFREKLDEFYAWGEILLRDFEEVDKYMVNAQQLYNNLKDIKDIESAIGLPEEVQLSVQKFLKAINRENYTRIQKSFLDLWEVLYPVYLAFRERLSQMERYYQGMAYRNVAEKALSGTLTLTQEHIVFAGLNLLSRSEEVLIHKLIKSGKASVYWDILVMGNKAARPSLLRTPYSFIGHYHKKWRDKNSILIKTELITRSRNIYITGVPQQVGQARFTGEKLLPYIQSSVTDPKRIGVILTDEQLLFPVLYSLPKETKALNITMGFPLRNTHIYQLLISVLSLLRSAKKQTGGGVTFYHRPVIAIFQNPFIKSLIPSLSSEICLYLGKENLIWTSEQALKKNPLPLVLQQIFTLPESVEAAFEYMENTFSLLLQEAEENNRKLEAEYLFFCFRQFHRLRDILVPGELTFKGFLNLLKESFKSIKIPFEGEPLEGIQIMGLLETRTLDFDVLFILNANEGTLPSERAQNSFIPNELRRGFQLPREQHRTQIVSYHFYRLLQRAKEIHIVYNTEVKSNGNSGEVSRFVLQLRHLFAGNQFPDIQFSQNKIALPSVSYPNRRIVIPNTPEIRQILTDKFGETGDNFHALSATSLGTYLTCGLKFYFKYIARLQKPRVVEAAIDDMKLGEMIHKVMEMLYHPYIKMVTTHEDFDRIIPKIPAVVKEVFVEFGYNPENSLEGKNYLSMELMMRACKWFVSHDAEESRKNPFVIEMLEKKHYFQYMLPVPLEGTSIRMRLDGNFDRLDRLRDKFRIVDYKTGKIEDLKVLDISKVFKRNSDTFAKTELQGVLYAYLLSKKEAFSRLPVTVGFYSLKKSGQALNYLHKGENIGEDNLISFEQELQVLISDILTKDFVQTTEESMCKLCEFNGICSKSAEEDE
ncbi:MAG: PD-(D/E)XK nuclease family protein [Bacteroidia bacterium]|nr:PD-(D/E)XK nuclease family protein [Bacteroidia bacterium]